MILHLVNDEKVINRTIENFEMVYPNQNFYLCFCKKGKDGYFKPNYIKYDNIFYYDPLVDKIDNLNLSIYKKIVIHYLTREKAVFCNVFLKHNPKIYYIIWGGDIYNGILYNRGYRLYSKENYFYRKYQNKEKLKIFVRKIIQQDKIEVDFIKNRVNVFFSTKGAIELLHKYIGLSIHSTRLDFFYYPVDQVLGKDLLDKSINKDANVILCGNSRSHTNNHEYVMNILKEVSIGESKIVMPLNYGYDLDYMNFIIKKGKLFFNEKFEAITNFLPLDEYNKLMLSVKIAVFGHWRGEAFGNIVICLYLGSKVYLSNKNPLLRGLIEMGLKIFELEKATKKDFLEPMNQTETISNRKIIIDSYNSERLYTLIREAFD
jgi:hypothetical protein